MDRLVSKLLALCVIFILTLSATLLPLRLTTYFERQGRQGRHLLACLSCFAGGVFLAIYLLHMAPDAHEIMHRAVVTPYNISYPITEVVIALGIFMMLFAEKAVLKLSKSHRRRHTTMDVVVIASDGSVKNEIVEGKPLASNGEMQSDAARDEHTQISHTHGVELSGVRSLVLLLALSLHHIFEGVTVGLQRTSVAVWSLCAAIVSHEIVVGFSLGLQLVRAYGEDKRNVVIAAVVCAMMTPVGVFIAIGIVDTAGGEGTSHAVDVTNGVLQSVATGVFIYVTFFEILAAEMTHADTSLGKLLCLVFGFTCMALLALIPEDKDLNMILTLATNVTNCSCAIT